MEVDYIRRKLLITVTVEVEVGGEGFLTVRVQVYVSLLRCSHCHMSQWIQTCMLFLMIIFSQSLFEKGKIKERCLHYALYAVCRQQAVNTSRKLLHARDTQFCPLHILALYHDSRLLFFFRQTSPVAPLNINYGKHFGLVPVLVSDFKSIYCLPPVDSLGLKKQVFSWWMAFIGLTLLRLSNKQHQHVCLSQISNGSLKWWGSLLRQKYHHWHH